MTSSMTESTNGAKVLARCSFCTKPDTQVAKLIAGPGVYICNECVSLCSEVLDLESESAAPPRPPVALWDVDQPLEQLLALLPVVASAGAQVEDNLARLVRKAHSDGATWARIGEALGMTRQSAWERFSGEE